MLKGLLTIFADFMGVLDLNRNGNIISGNYYLWIFRRNKKKTKMKKRMAKRKCSALICPIGLYEEAVLIYLFDDTHICISCLQNIQKFPIATEIIRLRNRFPFEMWERHRFSDLFPFRGSGFAVYICLVGGVVIFDELWAFTGIDIRVNSIHCPVFGDSEVNLAALLIYSEHIFADIHGKASWAPYEVRLLCFSARSYFHFHQYF